MIASAAAIAEFDHQVVESSHGRRRQDPIDSMNVIGDIDTWTCVHDVTAFICDAGEVPGRFVRGQR